MKYIMAVAVAVAVLFGATACVYHQGGKKCCKSENKECKADMSKCKAMDKAGKCDMSKCHVLAIKDGKAMCCTCGAACKCTLQAGDATKCSCGKNVKCMDLKGKFVCTHCNTIADKAGKCACGADLTEVK